MLLIENITPIASMYLFITILPFLIKLKIESPYHALTNGGHISYVKVDGDPVDNINAFEKIVEAMKDAGMGYGSINHPV